MVTDDNLNTPFGIGGVGDCIIVLQDLGSSTIDEVGDSISGLPDPAGGDGGPPPEITAEALRTILEGIDQTPGLTGASLPADPVGPGPISLPDGWPRLQYNNWDGTFRADARKVVFLVTDNLPGGYDSTNDPTDDQRATDMANLAASEGIIIQPILVELAGGGFPAGVQAIMENYATTTGGTLTEVPNSGEGIDASIIEDCGEDLEEKEGRMTGGGSVFHEDDKSNGRVTHGFTLHCDGGPNRLQVNWPGNVFHMDMLIEASCFDFPGLDEHNPVAGFDTITGSGVGRLNGVPGATVEFTFVDDGEPGKVSDTAIISINGGADLTVNGTLTKGNQQAHPEN